MRRACIGVVVVAAAGLVLSLSLWASGEGAKESRSAFNGQAKIKLTVDGNTLKVDSRAEVEVEGLIVVTYLTQAPMTIATPFRVTASTSLTQNIPLSFEGKKCLYYRVEVFEKTAGITEMVLVGSAVVKR